MQISNKYVIGLLILIVIIGVVVFSLNKKNSYKIDEEYTITVNKIDEFSPDRFLKIYKNDIEIDFQEVRYLDDVFLCNSLNPTVYFGDVIDEESLKVILNDDEYIIARVMEGKENEN